jgi:hypothetical protein
MAVAHPGSWENMYAGAGPQGMVLLGFKNPALKSLAGKTLADVARDRGTLPAETAMDLVVEDGSRVGVAYFLMDEANVRREVGLPWMSFGSDADAPALEGVFLLSKNHPRAYGNFARVLGHYVRETHDATLPDAIRRLTRPPADNLSLTDRGRLQVGAFADIVVFDPATARRPVYRPGGSSAGGRGPDGRAALAAHARRTGPGQTENPAATGRDAASLHRPIGVVRTVVRACRRAGRAPVPPMKIGSRV